MLTAAASGAPAPPARAARRHRWWGSLALVGLLGGVWAMVYLPRPTLLPASNQDGFYRISVGMQWAATGHLTHRLVDSPYPDSAALRQAAPTPVTLEWTYFLVLGLMARAGLLTLVTCRGLAAVSLLGVVLATALVTRRVTHWRVGCTAGMLMLLDSELWYAGRIGQSPTLTALLGLLGLLCAWSGAREQRRCRLGVGAAGVGLAQSLHPSAIVYGLGLALIVWLPLLVRRRWGLLLVTTVCAGLPVGAYGAHLVRHRAALATLLHEKEVSVVGPHAERESASVFERILGEPRRYHSGYPTPYWQRMGRYHQAAYVLGAVGWVMGGLWWMRRAWHAGRRYPEGIVGSAGVFWAVATLTFAATTSPAHKWGYYLIHTAPLLYVMAVFLVVEYLPARLARLWPWRGWAAVPTLLTVGLLVWLGMESTAFPRWYQTFDARWSHANVTHSLAAHVPRGALLVGSAASEAIAWATGAAFLHDRFILPHDTPLPQFPWEIERGPNVRLRRYRTNPRALATVAALAPDGLYLTMEERFLLWNASAPVGQQYGQAVRDWQEALNRYYVPVAEHYGAQDGSAVLHLRTLLARYMGEHDGSPPAPVRYWEGRRIELGPPLPGLDSVEELAHTLGESLRPDGSLTVSGGPAAGNIWTLAVPGHWGSAPALHVEFEIAVTGDPHSRFTWHVPTPSGEYASGPPYGHPQRLRHTALILTVTDERPILLAFQAPRRPSTGRLWAICVRPVRVVAGAGGATASLPVTHAKLSP